MGIYLNPIFNSRMGLPGKKEKDIYSDILNLGDALQKAVYLGDHFQFIGNRNQFN